MDVREFADEYARKADEELLLLATSSKELMAEAQSALADELRKRGIQPAPAPTPAPDQIRPMRIVVPAKQSLTPRREASPAWQVLWLFLHLIIVYVAVMFFSWRIAYMAHSLLGAAVEQVAALPLFDFFVSHVFLFSLIPGFVAGLAVARFNAKAAKYVWLVPAVWLALRILIFPTDRGSVLFGQRQSHWWMAFEYYFGTNLTDVTRGVAQIRTTVPFYAAVGYSGAAVVAARSRLHEALDTTFGWNHGVGS